MNKIPWYIVSEAYKGLEWPLNRFCGYSDFTLTTSRYWNLYLSHLQMCKAMAKHYINTHQQYQSTLVKYDSHCLHNSNMSDLDATLITFVY